MENQLNEHGKQCFRILISIDTGEFSNSLGCCIGFYEADLIGNSVLLKDEAQLLTPKPWRINLDKQWFLCQRTAIGVKLQDSIDTGGKIESQERYVQKYIFFHSSFSNCIQQVFTCIFSKCRYLLRTRVPHC